MSLQQPSLGSIRRMSRDQRVRDNWALLYAAEAAAKRGVPVAVAFNLVGFFFFFFFFSSCWFPWLEGMAPLFPLSCGQVPCNQHVAMPWSWCACSQLRDAGAE